MRALYISHTGMTEPLGRSQVLPYLRGIARAGWDIDLVAFEPHASFRQLTTLREELAAQNISYSWLPRSPAHGLAVKAAEGGKALVRLAAHVASRRPRIVHARSYLPGALAHAVTSVVPHARFLFDCRGLLADEYVDAGHWSRNTFRYHLTKHMERRLFARADAVVVLTERLKHWLYDETRLTPRHTLIEVIPCCVDLARFRHNPDARSEARRRLGSGDRFVLAYAGTLGSWYCEDEIARFFAALRRRTSAQLLVLTRSSTERLCKALRSHGIADSDIHVQAAAPDDMPELLAAADGALSFIRPVFSKLASSPVKLAEYLALGIPTVLNRGIGDTDQLLLNRDAVIDAGEMSAPELDRAAALLLSLDRVAASKRARELAERHYSLAEGIERYRRVYERLVS